MARLRGGQKEAVRVSMAERVLTEEASEVE